MHTLTTHFTLSELTRSFVATQRHIDNTPSAAVIENLRALAAQLEHVRTLLGDAPIVVSSGYRAPALNRAVGGVPNSAHLSGLAADFVCPSFGTPLQICRAIERSDIEFDQAIMEGTWVHFAVARAGERGRREVLTAHFGNGTSYTHGLAS